VAGPGARRDGEIGIASIRAGDIVGHPYSAVCRGSGERPDQVRSRGDRTGRSLPWAIRAASWLRPQKPGRYTMANVLGLKTSA
jgi:4-hydroxy-tetrahydrodipicolinate reductase